jgi:hypothetical protein
VTIALQFASKNGRSYYEGQTWSKTVRKLGVEAEMGHWWHLFSVAHWPHWAEAMALRAIPGGAIANQSCNTHEQNQNGDV